MTISEEKPLVRIRSLKRISRPALAKALGLPAARVEYFEEHAPLGTLEYRVNLKRCTGLGWETIGSILEAATVDTRPTASPLRGRGRPRLTDPPRPVKAAPPYVGPKRPRGRPRKVVPNTDEGSIL
jgi:hypothetical protein